MKESKSVRLVILASVNGRDHWFPVKPDEVPEWVREAGTVGRLVTGHACMKCDEGADGSLWYRSATEAELPDLDVMRAAQDKRAQRATH